MRRRRRWRRRRRGVHKEQLQLIMQCLVFWQCLTTFICAETIRRHARHTDNCD
jgi:hypothetical protein